MSEFQQLIVKNITMLQIICHNISVPANNDDSCVMIGITRK